MPVFAERGWGGGGSAGTCEEDSGQERGRNANHMWNSAELIPSIVNEDEDVKSEAEKQTIGHSGNKIWFSWKNIFVGRASRRTAGDSDICLKRGNSVTNSRVEHFWQILRFTISWNEICKPAKLNVNIAISSNQSPIECNQKRMKINIKSGWKSKNQKQMKIKIGWKSKYFETKYESLTFVGNKEKSDNEEKPAHGCPDCSDRSDWPDHDCSDRFLRFLESRSWLLRSQIASHFHLFLLCLLVVFSFFSFLFMLMLVSVVQSSKCHVSPGNIEEIDQVNEILSLFPCSCSPENFIWNQLNFGPDSFRANHHTLQKAHKRYNVKTVKKSSFLKTYDMSSPQDGREDE